MKMNDKGPCAKLSSRPCAHRMAKMGSIVLDAGGIPHDDNLNTLNELKKMVQASLYTELAPMLTPRRLPPTRMPENDIS